MNRKTQESFKEMRKIIMDDILDQRQALLALAHLDNLKTQMQLAEERVSDRESILQDANMKLSADLCKAIDLLRDFGKVVENDRGGDYHLLYQLYEFLTDY